MQIYTTLLKTIMSVQLMYIIFIDNIYNMMKFRKLLFTKIFKYLNTDIIIF